MFFRDFFLSGDGLEEELDDDDDDDELEDELDELDEEDDVSLLLLFLLLFFWSLLFCLAMKAAMVRRAASASPASSFVALCLRGDAAAAAAAVHKSCNARPGRRVLLLCFVSLPMSLLLLLLLPRCGSTSRGKWGKFFPLPAGRAALRRGAGGAAHGQRRHQ